MKKITSRLDQNIDGSTDGNPRYSRFPFGGSARVCYGQRFAIAEAVLIMVVVVLQFHLALSSG
jgi:cytochrome P450